MYTKKSSDVFRILNNLKADANQDVEDQFLSREDLVRAIDYYKKANSEYNPLYKNDHAISGELIDLRMAIYKLEEKLALLDRGM